MTNEDLIFQTEIAIKNERNATAEVVRLFAEIQTRKLFLEMGYPSLFEMATKHFGLCNQSAWLRIAAMKLIRTAPEVEAKLESGELSLTSAANIQSFVAKDKTVDVHDLIETCLGKSTREVERELARLNPEIEKRETIRQTSDERVRVSHGSSNRLESKLEQIRQAWSHKNPSMSREELLERMADQILKSLEPKSPRSQKPSKHSHADDQIKSETDAVVLPAQEVERAQAAPTMRTRYISRKTKETVIERNAHSGCEFISETGQRCGSKHQLQFDHIKPYSHGGLNSAENPRIYCAQHNRWRHH